MVQTLCVSEEKTGVTILIEAQYGDPTTMSRIVGAFVSKRATSSAKDAQRYAHDWGKVRGNVREAAKGFVIGKSTGRRHEVSQDLTVYVE